MCYNFLSFWANLKRKKNGKKSHHTVDTKTNRLWRVDCLSEQPCSKEFYPLFLFRTDSCFHYSLDWCSFFQICPLLQDGPSSKLRLLSREAEEWVYVIFGLYCLLCLYFFCTINCLIYCPSLALTFCASSSYTRSRVHMVINGL